MTVWVLHQTLTAEEEARIFERADLVLPFGALPDLSQVSNPQAARKLLAVLYPADPPESINRKVERFWYQFSTMQIEDLIVVPLPSSKTVVLAEISGHYHYEVGEGGSDIHLIPVRWYEKRIPMSTFAKHKEIFSHNNSPMSEVMAADARTALRDHLPHSYNRFAKLKWLMVLFFAMGLVRLFIRLEH